MASTSSSDGIAADRNESSSLHVSHRDDGSLGRSAGEAAVTSNPASNDEGARGGDSAADSSSHILTEGVQQITLTGSDCKEGMPVHSRNVKIVASTKTTLATRAGAENNQCASALVTSNSIATQVWESGYYNGKLISGNKTFVAYAVKGRSGYVIRVINLATQVRTLIHGPYEGIADLAFAHSNSNVLACVDTKGNLFVWQLTDGTAIEYSVMLIVNAPEPAGSESSVQRVIWCPHIAGTEVEEASTQFLVVVRGRNAEVLDLDLAASAQVGDEPMSHEALKHGVAVVANGHEPGLLDAALSPDAAVLATAGIDGHVKFWQVDQTNVAGPPHCLHDWSPHDGAPVSSIMFCDDRTRHVPEHSFWRFVVTGSERNRVLKIWCTVTWTCLQTVGFEAGLEEGGVFSVTLPSLQVALDDSARYIILSDVQRKVLYLAHIIQLAQEGNAYVDRFNEYVLSQPVLSFSIVSVAPCSSDAHTVISDLSGVSDQSQEKKNGVAIKLCCIQPKAIQELTVFLADSDSLAPSQYAADGPHATQSAVSTSASASGSSELTSDMRGGVLQASSPLLSSSADKLEESLATALSSSLNLSASAMSSQPTVTDTAPSSSLLLTEMLNGLQDRPGGSLNSSTTLLTPAAFASGEECEVLSGEPTASFMESPTSSPRLSYLPTSISSTSSVRMPVSSLHTTQVSPGQLPPLMPLQAPSLRPAAPLIGGLPMSPPVSFSSLPPLAPVSNSPGSMNMYQARLVSDGEKPAIPQDTGEESQMPMRDAGAAEANESPAFELKVTEGRGDSGLESDQDVIIIAEEEQDEEEEETAEGAVKDSSDVSQREETAPAEDISAEQLGAVLDEALREAAVQQHLPGSEDVEGEDAKKKEESRPETADLLNQQPEQAVSSSIPSLVVLHPAEDSRSDSAGSDTGMGRTGIDSGGEMASEVGAEGRTAIASSERPHRRRRSGRRRKQHGSVDSHDRLEDAVSDTVGSSHSGVDLRELSGTTDLHALLREQQKELAQLRHLLHSQQTQMQAAVRSAVEAESQRSAAQQLQRMQDMAQHCVKEEQHHLEKFLRDRQSAEKARNERLQSALSTNLTQTVGAKVDKSVKAELKASIIPAFNNSMANISKQMRESLAGQESVLGGSLANAVRSKPVIDALNASLVSVTSSNDSAFKRAWRQSFDTVFLPGVERSVSAMLSQVNAALHRATQEYAQQMEAVLANRRHTDDEVLLLIRQRMAQVADKQEVLPAELAQALGNGLQRNIEDAVSSQLSQLRESIIDRVKGDMMNAVQQQALVIQQQLQQLQGQLMQQITQGLAQHTPQYLQQLTTTIQQQHQQISQQQQQILSALSQTQQEMHQQLAVLQSHQPGSLTSNGVGGVPAMTEKQQREARIIQLIQQKDYQQAFHEALSASDLQHVLTVCKSVHTEELFGTPPCPLNQQILLSLVQQLSSDLTTEVDLKICFLQGALSNLNSSDTVTKKYGPAVLQRLCGSIDVLPSSPHSGAFSLLKMAAQTVERYAQQA